MPSNSGAMTTDHSAAATYARGLDHAQLRAQLAEIDAMAAPDARILRGTEADILAESVNALPEDTLKDALVAISTATTR